MTSVIRRARSVDLDTIRAVERASAQRFVGLMDDIAADEPVALPTLMARLAADGLRVAEADGQVVGSVMFRPVDGDLYVEQIDVLPAFAGQRIGAALLEAVAKQARQTGLDRLTLSTFRDVPWNAPWYRRLGFFDLADAALTPGLLKIRRDHVARGLDETVRTFMARPI